MKTFISSVLIALAYLVFGAMDYADELRERDYYCEMVAAGAWPDYRGSYGRECGDE